MQVVLGKFFSRTICSLSFIRSVEGIWPHRCWNFSRRCTVSNVALTAKLANLSKLPHSSLDRRPTGEGNACHHAFEVRKLWMKVSLSITGGAMFSGSKGSNPRSALSSLTAIANSNDALTILSISPSSSIF